ncbi:T9SS type A sorting domain-containing protein [Flavobacterium sp.]|uniref:DUF7619 domain-containing protein n=1 Tax=Flavobacterium sp. TaxID=239 RepID=UPI00260E6DDF|nr:T9SS type A sorting domain-containing protein [Flavobacterium sp.]
MRKLFIVFTIFFLSLLQAQNPAGIDLTFDFKDKLPLLNNQPTQSIIQTDGKIIVIGSFTKYIKYRNQENNSVQILRLNNDLSIDETFSSNTGFNGIVYAVAIQTDGKILVGGNFTAYNGTTGIQKIVRLNGDGSIDPTFVNSSIPAAGGVSCIEVQPDNKILIGGNFIFGNQTLLIRLNANGSIDNSFYFAPAAGNSSTNIYLKTINLLSNGKILAGGKFNGVGGIAERIVLLNTNGTIDASFNAAPFNIPIANVTIQPDGKILIATTTTYGIDDELLRLESNGTIDNSFNLGSGFDVSDFWVRLEKPVLQANGDIVVYGNFISYNGNTVNGRVRMHANGTFDNTYNYQTDAVSIIKPLLQPDGNILGYYAAGVFANNGVFAFIRLDPNGYVLDNQQPSTITRVNKVFEKTNGAIMTLGTSTYSNIFYHRAKLMDQDGNLIYHPNLKNPGYNADSYCNLIQTDGKLLLSVTDLDGYNYRVIRLNTDYSVDPTFNRALTSNPTASNLQADGKILMAFGYLNNDGSLSYRVERFNTDGTSDASFTLALGTNGYGSINKIDVRPDGKILAAGQFTSYNGVSKRDIVRLNSDGTIDATFNMPMINGSGLYAIAIQSDGKIVIADGLLGLFRLNAVDGTFDSSFNAPANLGGVYAIALQTDGKIVVGGSLRIIGINECYGIARLNSNGSLDSSFDPGIGFDNAVNSILIESNGKILVGGDFSRYNGTFCNGLIRLVGGDGFLVKGKVKFDSNNNGCDIADINFPHIKLNITSGSTTNALITDTTGDYSYTVAPGTYTVTPEVSNIFTISPTSFTVTFPSDASPFVQDFCLTSNGIHPDLEVTIVPLNTARPGFDAKYKIIYKNKGNQLHSGSVTLNFNDAAVDLVTASPNASSQTINNLTWNYTNLLPLEKREILLTFNLNTPTETPPLNIGSILNYTTTITSSITDETPNDNTFTFHQIVENSFDPNDKTCLEGATIGINEIGDYVHYMIRFENKGTYNAQNISVKDLIDTAKFDINTLTPINGSHLFVTRITEGNKVEFYFEDINLPFADATNDGYVAFKIKTKATLVGGDSFSNSAAIFFDYNSAVNTNTATTTIQALAVRDFAFDQYFTVYPNPANDQLSIEKKDNIAISSLSVFNILGQQVITVPNARNTSTIDVSGLKSGNYFLIINSDKGISNTKFIKL